MFRIRFFSSAIISLLFFTTLYAQAQEPQDELEKETAEKVLRDYQENLEQNAISGKELYKELQQNKLRENGKAFKGSIDWQYLGPMNQGGRVRGLAVSWQNSAKWYCAADGGGVWRSDNSGDAWYPISDTLPSLHMSALAICPKDDNFLLAGTQDGIVYRTLNGGQSWQVIPLPVTEIQDIQFHPADAGRILLGASGGLYESRDSGQTWKAFRTNGRAMSVNYNPADPAQLLYTLNDLSGRGYILLSRDSGKTWKSMKMMNAAYYSTIKARYCKSHPEIVYAAFADQNQVYKSTDSGNTWQLTATQPFRDNYTRGFDYLEVAPNDPDVVVTGSTSIFRTTDGGKTWHAGDTINRDVHVDQHAFLFPASMPNTLIAANDGGVFSTSDFNEYSLAWKSRNNKLATLEIYNCTFHPDNTSIVVTGCQDNGYDKYSGDVSNWKIIGGDGFCSIFDKESPQYFYHEYVYGNLHRADDGFSWWSAKKMNGLPTDNSGSGFYTGFTSPDRADWFGQAIAMSPFDSKVLYIGSNYLYKTADRAESWSKLLNKDFSKNSYDYISTINPAPSNSSIIYIGNSSGKMYQVKDTLGSATWTDISTPQVYSRVRSIAVSPNDYKKIYAAGDNGWQNKGVLRSTDGGKSWVVASKGLPKGQVNRLLIDPYDEHVLYTAHSYGLYYSTDEGDTWQKMPDFPNVEVWDLYMSTKDGNRTLLAGTYGRGAIMVENLELPGTVSIRKEQPAIQFASVYPVPASGIARLEFRLSQKEKVSIGITDALGRKISLPTQTLEAGIQSVPLDLRQLGLGSGIYYISIQCSTAATCLKMIVE